jgi:hypothetical protein
LTSPIVSILDESRNFTIVTLLLLHRFIDDHRYAQRHSGQLERQAQPAKDVKVG